MQQTNLRHKSGHTKTSQNHQWNTVYNQSIAEVSHTYAIISSDASDTVNAKWTQLSMQYRACVESK